MTNLRGREESFVWTGLFSRRLFRPRVFKTRHDLRRNLRYLSIGVHPYDARLAGPTRQQRGFVTEVPNAPVDDLWLVVCPSARCHALPDHIVWRVKHHNKCFGHLMLL